MTTFNTKSNLNIILKIISQLIVLSSAILSCINTSNLNNDKKDSIEGTWELVSLEVVNEKYLNDNLISSESQIKYPGFTESADSVKNILLVIDADAITSFRAGINCYLKPDKYYYIIKGDTIVDNDFYYISDDYKCFMTFNFANEHLLTNEYVINIKLDTVSIEKEIWKYKAITDKTSLPSWFETQCP